MEDKNDIRVREAITSNAKARSFLAMCVVVAGASTGLNGVVLGVVMMAMMLCGRLLLCILQKLLNDNGRIAASILIYCALAGVAVLLADRCFASLTAGLGIYIPLCAVACIVSELTDLNGCARGGFTAVAYAFLRSIETGMLLTLIGLIREFLGTGKLFGAQVLSSGSAPVLFAQYPVSGLVLLGVICGITMLIHRKGDAE